MKKCSHRELTLLPGSKPKARCRHCHLTLFADELGEDYCPECYEVDGEKRSDFEIVETADGGKTRYRCEKCNIIIEYPNLDGR